MDAAGESDIDQLYRIQKCLGPLPSSYMEAMRENPKFDGVKVNLFRTGQFFILNSIKNHFQ